MLAASVVLVTTGRGYLRPALIQGILPLIGIVLMLFS
jgi:putative membrane protein